ncbi:MAG: methyltransferase family protein, partial [Terriglobales bacterium]
MPSPTAPGNTPPSPEAIMGALTAFQQTAVLKAALALDVFTQIGEGRGTLAALASACQASERGMRILCDRLTVMELLRKQENHYQLTPDSAAFLNRRSPAYLGSAADFLAGEQQIEAFARFAEAVRRGGSALPGDPAMQPDSPQWVSFARNMAPLQRMPAQALAELLLPKPTPSCKVLDVAAGHGLFGVAMAQRNPNAEIYALDWPKVLAVAQENAAAAGVADRLHLIPGSAFEVELGKGYDWVLLPNFLHHFDVATCEA